MTMKKKYLDTLFWIAILMLVSRFLYEAFCK